VIHGVAGKGDLAAPLLGPAILGCVDGINTFCVSAGRLAYFRVVSRSQSGVSAAHAVLCVWFDSRHLHVWGSAVARRFAHKQLTAVTDNQGRPGAAALNICGADG
jgi:hypothetical protein